MFLLLSQERANIIDTDSKFEDREEMESSIKASRYFISCVFVGELFITKVAVKSFKTIVCLSNCPLTDTFCFYFGAQVSTYQVNPPRLCSICVLTLPCNDHLNPIWIDTVFFGMLPILGDPLPPSHPESPIHPSTLLPPHDLLSHAYTVVLCVRRGQGEVGVILGFEPQCARPENPL